MSTLKTEERPQVKNSMLPPQDTGKKGRAN